MMKVKPYIKIDGGGAMTRISARNESVNYRHNIVISISPRALKELLKWQESLSQPAPKESVSQLGAKDE